MSQENKIRILVFGSPTVGKTSLINMLTNTNNTTRTQFLSMPFQFQDIEYEKDNQSYIFTDTTGICASDFFGENTANSLKTFLLTKKTSYNLIIHVIKIGPINTMDRDNYNLIIKNLFENCNSLCVITFAENVKEQDLSNWWSLNENKFSQSQMKYTDGIAICSLVHQRPNFDQIYQPLRQKSKDSLWDLIKQHTKETQVIAKEKKSWIQNIFDLSKYLRSLPFYTTFRDKIFGKEKIGIDSNYQKAWEIPNYFITVICDLNKHSQPFLSSIFEINIGKSYGPVEKSTEKECYLKLELSSCSFEIEFINMQQFTKKKNREIMWYQMFTFLGYKKKEHYLSNLMIVIDNENNEEINSVLNFLQELFNPKIEIIKKSIHRQTKDIFEHTQLESLTRCKIEFVANFWNDICDKKNFLKSVELDDVEIKIYDFILMCNSSSEKNIKEHEDRLNEQGWIKFRDSVSDCEKNTNGYVGVAYKQLSIDKSECYRVAFAHQGPSFNKFGNIDADLAIALSEKPKIIKDALNFEKTTMELIQNSDSIDKKTFKIIHTGFSLGGFIAASCVLDKMTQKNYFAVTFDAPGCKFLLPENNHNLKSESISNYVTQPNLVNTCQEHVGKIIQLFKPNNETNQVSLTVDELINTYKTHNRKDLIDLLGKSLKLHPVNIWPKATYKLEKEDLKKIIPIFKSSDSNSIASYKISTMVPNLKYSRNNRVIYH
jgi:GTPase SAR1 family protein